MERHEKESRLRDSPPAAGRVSDIFHSAAVRSTGGFYTIGNEISYRIKKRLKPCSSGFETVINFRYYRGTTQIDVTSTLVILCVCMHYYARRADNGSGYPPTPT